MPYDRKTELLKTEPPTRPTPVESREKLQERADEAGMYMNLTSNLGWKRLMRDYIVPRSSMDRLMVAPADKLADERAGVKELVNLLNFINEKVKDGTRAFEKLKSE
jgi:hypothetical protein